MESVNFIVLDNLDNEIKNLTDIKSVRFFSLSALYYWVDHCEAMIGRIVQR